MFSQLLKLAAVLAITGLVDADCRLHNQLKEPETEPETRPEVCKPMGADRWTFTMINSEISVPTLNGQNPNAGVTGGDAFRIFDNECVLRGEYSPDNEGNDCGTPYTIQEGFLPYTVVITDVSMMIGRGDFSFAYADGAYMIGENGATCESITDGLDVGQACRADFPINSEPGR